MIPKIIHFVWLGNSVPEWAEANMAGFVRNNPGFEVRLSRGWDKIEDHWKVFLPECRTVAGQSDVIRLGLLERFGGWYCDTDVLCMKSLAQLHEICDLNAADKLVLLDSDGYEVNNGVMAARPGGPVWSLIREAMKAETLESRYRFGPDSVSAIGRGWQYRIPKSYYYENPDRYTRAVAGETWDGVVFVHKCTGAGCAIPPVEGDTRCPE